MDFPGCIQTKVNILGFLLRYKHKKGPIITPPWNLIGLFKYRIKNGQTLIYNLVLIINEFKHAGLLSKDNFLFK